MTPRAIGVPTGLRRASALRWRSDERLARLAAAGDEAAFGVLYERHHQALYRYCRSIVRDEHDAQDALQAAMAAAFVGAGTWRPGVPVRAWLFRIAHNEVVDRLRHRARHPELPIDLFRERSGSERSPEDLAADADAHVRIRTLLSTLPPRERAVLELRAADLDTHQIAAVLGVTEHNVRSTQCRALARMRTSLTQAGVLSLEVVGD